MHKIICKNVPEALLKKEAAKNHFRKFGSAKRIVFRSASRIITVEYGGEEAIEKVLKYGNVYDNKTFTILRELSDDMENSESTKSRSIKKPLNIPDEVMAELDAMGGGPSLALVNKSNLRREVLNVEKPKKALKRRVPVDKEKGTPKKNKSLAFSRNDEYQQLLEILNQRAITIEEKYKVLDARDKILRILRKKNGAKNGFTRGTCPDMCPEKERLLRVIQHQVSYYEQNSSKEMDPSLAVKQYSRSSADQESPLPHELRPVNVLQTTMLYLIRKVMDPGETSNVNLGDWYHFLWDRTRSIRKDITQQELCCQRSVELIEQCARFHIHCSARLVAEDPSVFDQKINTENLTKCLQTLKYMYHDLRLKKVKCPNEAEFRAYIILLNLNDGNFMWEVQRLPLEIQESQEVRDSIQIYSALNTNNFVKFFKLVRNTIYLNACILMRYFMQVRFRAIDMVLKCYTPRITKVVYPLETLTLNLGFESVNHTIEFLQSCGLEMNASRTCVTLDKSAYIAPDLTYTALDRSINLVESKRGDLSLGMIVFGGELPSFQYHILKSSFDDDGFLEEKLFTEDDLDKPLEDGNSIKIEEIIPEVTSTEPPAQSSKSQESLSPEQNEDSHIPSEENIFPLQEEHNASASTSPPPLIEIEHFEEPVVGDNLLQIHPAATNLNKSIFGYKPDNQNTNIFGGKKTNISEEKLESDETLQPSLFIEESNENDEVETPPSNSCHTIKNHHVNMGLSSQNVFKVVQQPLNCESTDRLDGMKAGCSGFPANGIEMENNSQMQKSKELRQRKENDIEMEAIKSVVEDVISVILDEVVSMEEITEKLKHLRSRIQRRMLMKVINKWQAYTSKMKRKREANDWFSGLLCMRSLSEGAAAYNLNPNIPAQRRLSLNLGDSMWKYVEKERKVDFPKYARNLTKRYQKLGLRKKPYELELTIYWKCIISLSGSHDDLCDTLFMDQTLQSYFKWKDAHTPLVVQEFGEGSVVRFCITKQIGSGDVSNDANGLIFMARTLSTNLQRRISEKFLTTGIYFSVPIVIIVQDEPTEDHQLNSLVNQGIITEYLILHDYQKHGFMNLVEKGLNFLTKRAWGPPPIEVNQLETVLFRKYLCSGVWQQIICSSNSNAAFKECLKNPNILFKLYNDGLKRLKGIILDPSCYEYGRFAAEFMEFEESASCFPVDYKHLPELAKDEEYKNYVSRLFSTVMSLRPFSYWPPRNETELQNILWEFCVRNFGQNSTTFYHNFLAHLLEMVNDDISQLGNIMWIDVFDIIMAEKYRSYMKSSTGRMPESWHYHNNLLVVYHKVSLEGFLSMEWLNVTNPIIQSVLNYDMDSDSTNTRGAECCAPTSTEIDNAIAEAKLILQYETDCDLGFGITDFDEQIEDLSNSMRVSRRLTSRFEKHFRDAFNQE